MQNTTDRSPYPSCKSSTPAQYDHKNHISRLYIAYSNKRCTTLCGFVSFMNSVSAMPGRSGESLALLLVVRITQTLKQYHLFFPKSRKTLGNPKYRLYCCRNLFVLACREEILLEMLAGKRTLYQLRIQLL